MGKTSDQLERELREHRDEMTRKQEALRERVREDIHDARRSVTDEISQRTKLHEYAEEHPLATVAAAFGTGIALGSFTGGGGNSDQPTKRWQESSGASNGGAGLLGGLLGGVAGPVAGTIQDEIRTLLRDVIGRDDAAETKVDHKNEPMARR